MTGCVRCGAHPCACDRIEKLCDRVAEAASKGEAPSFVAVPEYNHILPNPTHEAAIRGAMAEGDPNEGEGTATITLPKPVPLRPGELPHGIKQALASKSGKNRRQRRMLDALRRRADRKKARKDARS